MNEEGMREEVGTDRPTEIYTNGGRDASETGAPL